MQTAINHSIAAAPWNEGKLMGQGSPLEPRETWTYSWTFRTMATVLRNGYRC